MPIEVVYFMDDRGEAPVLEWLRQLEPKVLDKCSAKILRLAEMGHQLGRPEAAYLRDGIYELRVVHTGRQFRILHFFHGRQAVVLTHSFVKKSRRVPDREIDLAIKRKNAFERDVIGHTFTG